MERQPSRFMLRELAGAAAGAVAQRVADARGGRGRSPLSSARGPMIWCSCRTSRPELNAVLRSIAARTGRRSGRSRIWPTAPSRWLPVSSTRERGATLRTVEMPYPIRDAGGVVEAIAAALTPRTRLAGGRSHHGADRAGDAGGRDRRAQCHARGVPVLVDGAHAPGLAGRRHSVARRRTGTAPTCTSGRTRRGLRHPVGGTRPSAAAAASDRFLGLRPGLPRGVRVDRHRRPDRLSGRAGRHRAAARVGLRGRARLHARPRVGGGGVAHGALGHDPRDTARDGRRDGDRPAAGAAGATEDDATRLRLALLVDDRIEVQLHAWRGRLWVRVSAQVYNDRRTSSGWPTRCSAKSCTGGGPRADVICAYREARRITRVTKLCPGKLRVASCDRDDAATADRKRCSGISCSRSYRLGAFGRSARIS